jgi:hypothetical protein
MRRPLMLVAAILAGLLVAGCGGSGHSADPPANVVALAGDGIVTVTWPMTSGVEYWMFYGPSPSISTSNWTTILGSQSVIGASSPSVATGLVNGTIYSFTLNGRTDGGPGGPGTPSVSAIPRLAGTASASLPAPWTAGSALSANDLRGVTWGTVFVAVGANGAMFSSTDGTKWNPLTSGVTANLNAAVFRSVYLAAGDGGAMLYSIDAITWTPRTTGTANNLNAIATNSGLFVAVGANGTIVFSGDGITWTKAANSATTNDLFAVTATAGGTWIAVGAGGTLVTSIDGSNWTVVDSKTTFDLRGVASGTSTATTAALFVAVGANGTLVTSPDAATWTAQTAIGTNTLSAITYATQFIAVGANGSIFTSTDGTTWTDQPPPTIDSNLNTIDLNAINLNAIVHALFGYSVVGAAGVNLLAK